VGGFPVVLTHEDTFAAARLIAAGHKIAYVAEAIVRHSHRYTLRQEFCRFADTGFARTLYRLDRLFNQRDEGRGRLYAHALLASAYGESFRLLPYALAQLFVRYSGYRLGSFAVRLPSSVMRSISSQDYYWASVHHLGNS